MLEIYTLPPTQVGISKNGSPAAVCETENAKAFEAQAEVDHRSWSFTAYPPERVAHLYHNWKKCFDNPQVHPGVKEAYEQGLGLLEVCTGDYDNPYYIAIATDLNIEALKKQWHLDYCLFYRLVTRNPSNREKAGSGASVTVPNQKEEECL